MESNAIVIDSGSYLTRAGIAGEEAPRTVFNTVIGIPKVKMYTGLQDDTSVGSKAYFAKALYFLKYPIQYGKVVDYKQMELIWKETLSDLHIDCTDRPILLAEIHQDDKQNMAEYMFEGLNTPKLYIGSQSSLSLYASGRTTGLVLSSGHGITSATPFFEGYCIKHACNKQSLAGYKIDEYLQTLLKLRHIEDSVSSKIEHVNDIKNKCGIVEFEKDLHTNYTATYDMPDGNKISVGKECIQSMELLFNPSINCLYEMGVHLLVHDAIKKSDVDLRRVLYDNIVLSGGTTTCKNYSERLEKELNSIAPSGIEPKVIASPDRKYLAWIGGATISAMSSFSEKWVEKKEWEEIGNSIINTKCSE